MSLPSLPTWSAGFLQSSLAGSPTHSDRTPSKNEIDLQELDQKLRAFRDRTPQIGENIDSLKAQALQHYDQIIALGGRPTRPILQYPKWKAYMAEGTNRYRECYEKIEVICEVDKCRASTHWAQERNYWGDELWQWQEFKKGQQIHGRSELDLELENTDVALVGALSRLNDWQEFKLLHQKKVQEAETFHEECQQEIVRIHNAMIADNSEDEMFTVPDPFDGWMSSMIEAQKELESSRKKLVWVTSQWTEVVAEACSSIPAVPELQRELEAKFETVAKALYRTLQEKGAGPSHSIHFPDIYATFPQRIIHWILEISGFDDELWDWKSFAVWRRHFRNVNTTKQEGQKHAYPVDVCSELAEDLVKYHQLELDRSISWMNSWRHQAKTYLELEGKGETSLRYELRYPPWSDVRDCSYYDSFDENEITEAEQAEIFAMQAEEKVSLAAKRLKQSKQSLQDILTKIGHTITDGISTENLRAQPPRTPPKLQSPASLSKNQRSLKKGSSAKKGHRRSKKEKVRKMGAKPGNTSTEQQPLQSFSLGSNDPTKDNDIEMSDDAEYPSSAKIQENPSQALFEDTNMPDTEESPQNIPPSPPESHFPSAKPTKHNEGPSPSPPGPTSRRTRSTPKLDQILSSRIIKKSDNKKKAKVFTEQQATALLNIASTDFHSARPTTLRRSERLKEKAAVSKGRMLM